MFPLLFAAALAVQIGPPGSDAAREPQMATIGASVALTFGAGNSIYFTASQDSGRTFSTPVKVAEAQVLPLNRHRGPRIAVAGDAIVISAVGGQKLADGPHAHGLPSDGDLWVWRSVDRGKTWSKGVRVNDVPGAPTEGLHSLASDGKRNLLAAWLDHRGNQGTKLYGARSSDGGLTWSKNVEIYRSPEGTICECCHPSIAIAPDGEMLVMWRNWLAGARDMYLARSRDGINFSKAEKLGVGTWKLNGCPMDGGGLVIVENRAVSVWRRDGEIFMASPGENEVRLGKGIDVALAAGQHGIHAVWSTPEGIVSLSPGSRAPVPLAPKGTFPNVVALPAGRALAAWEADNGIVVQVIH